MKALSNKYLNQVKKRAYVRLRETVEQEIIATETFELIANFSFVPQTQAVIKRKLEKYDIDSYDFSIHFDGATFEYFPKQLKVTVYVFQHHYSFDFTKPQHLGQPRSKGTEIMLLGRAPK